MKITDVTHSTPQNLKADIKSEESAFDWVSPFPKQKLNIFVYLAK